jgi:hypothetical protein
VLLAIVFVKTLQQVIRHKHKINYDVIPVLGCFAFLLPLLISCFQIYKASKLVEEVGDISISLIAAGIRLEIIPMIYGLVVFILSLMIWIMLKSFFKSE